MVLNSEDTFNIVEKLCSPVLKVHLYSTFQTRISQCEIVMCVNLINKLQTVTVICATSLEKN